MCGTLSGILVRTPSSVPFVERSDSNISTASAHYSPYLRTPSSDSFTSSSSADSLDPGMSERVQQIQTKIRLMEKVGRGGGGRGEGRGGRRGVGGDGGDEERGGEEWQEGK